MRIVYNMTTTQYGGHAARPTSNVRNLSVDIVIDIVLMNTCATRYHNVTVPVHNAHIISTDTVLA